MPEKMKLELDSLNVESFEAEAQAMARRGTVQGAEMLASIAGTCYDGTCRGYGTCNIYPCKPIP
jgi:hypothetical protein